MDAAGAYARLAVLRYIGENSAGLLRHVLDNRPGLDKDVETALCDFFGDHDRHARELNAVLRDAGHQGEPVPEHFELEFDRRIAEVGEARDKDAVLAALAGLESFAAEQYDIALRTASAEQRGTLERQRDDERAHAEFLREKAVARVGR